MGLKLSSLAGFVWPQISIILLGLWFIIMLVVAYKNPPAAVALLAIELIVGTQGNLFFANLGSVKLSIRMVLFVAFLLSWLVRRRKELKSLFALSIIRWWLALTALFIFSALVGLISGNGVKQIFLDGNGYLFFLLLPPVIDVVRAFPEQRLKIFKRISPAFLWLFIETLIIFFIFTQRFAGISNLYLWYQWSRAAEIASLPSGMSRVFMQSQIYVAIILLGMWVISATQHLKRKETMRLVFFGSIAMAVTLISGSRSIWVGSLAGLVLVSCFLIYFKIATIRKLTATFIVFILMAGLGFGLMYTLSIPVTNRNRVNGNIVKDRTSQVGDAGTISRMQLLQPLIQASLRRPIIGSGFGATISYTTADQRAIAASGGTTYTTFSFEWGWLDIIYKFGLGGLIIFVGFFWQIVRDLLVTKKRPVTMLALGSLVSLLFVHAFTPYVNHPLGIGLIIAIAAYAVATKPRNSEI